MKLADLSPLKIERDYYESGNIREVNFNLDFRVLIVWVFVLTLVYNLIGTL